MDKKYKDGEFVHITYYSHDEPLSDIDGVVTCGGNYIEPIEGAIPIDPSKIWTMEITELPLRERPLFGVWTSVEEKQPDCDGDYLATVKQKAVDGWNDNIVVAPMRFKNGDWLSKAAGLTGYHCEEVLAWQPLPKPYEKASTPFLDEGSLGRMM